MAQLPTTSPPTLLSPPPPRDRFIRHANLMSLLTILSRVFGLVRDKTWSAYLGLNAEFSAFWMGFQYANLFRRIFGEGALTAIFVPIYTRTLHNEGPRAANRLAAVTATLLITVLGTLILLGETVLIPIALSDHVLANNRLAAAMIAIMLPYCLLVCLVAFFSAIASVHERFTAQSISPIILNLVTAFAAVLPVLLFTANYPFRQRVYWVAVSVLLAGLLQVLQMLPTLRRSGVRLRLLFDPSTPGLREIVTSMLPMILGLSAVQFNTFMDGQIAWWLSPDAHDGAAAFTFLGHLVHTPMGPGAMSKLSIAQRIYMLPVGIFGVSMATALFPLLAKAATHNDLPEVKRLLVAGLRKTLFLSLPASAGMILIAEPLITLIYASPKTHPEDIHRAAWAAIWFCAGIWAFEAQLVLLRVFYSLRDTKTPMKLAVAMVALNFALNISLVWFMQEGGLAASTTISAIVQSTILLLILRRRHGTLGLAHLSASLLKGLLACTVMVLATLALGPILARIRLTHPNPMTEKLLRSLIDLPVLVLTAVAIYALMAYLLKMPELQDLPLLGRFFRRRSGDTSPH